MNPSVRALLLVGVVALSACRIETAAPGQPAQAASASPAGEVWVYTSMYRHVLDALDPVLQRALPQVRVRWFQAGSEKVATRLEAELAAGGTQCDVLVTSDPFLYERFKREGRWLRYVSPNALRTPRALMDLDGHYAALRLSTMVLVRAAGAQGPTSFEALADPRFRGEVAVGDPLTSGTAFTWAVALERKYGEGFFARLRDNEVRVAGGNAAVLQKIEGHEVKTGVLLLENALAARAKGSPVEVVWPSDGAVLIPGYAAILGSSRNAPAARAVVDVLFSQEGQEVISRLGDMHAVDPRLPGPRGEVGLDGLLARSQPWDEALVGFGLERGAQVKANFSQAFAK